jgi:hypothetical protein
MERSAQNRDDFKRNGIGVQVAKKDTLELDRMLTSVDPLIFEEIILISGLYGID